MGVSEKFFCTKNEMEPDIIIYGWKNLPLVSNVIYIVHHKSSSVHIKMLITLNCFDKVQQQISTFIKQEGMWLKLESVILHIYIYNIRPFKWKLSDSVCTLYNSCKCLVYLCLRMAMWGKIARIKITFN